jgi:two-component system, response regulator
VTIPMKTVLLVEDNPEDQHMTLQALRMCPTPNIVRVAHNGLEALAMLKEGNLPAFIILDIHMPMMDGHEFLTAFREKDAHRNVPVIVMSATTKVEDVAKSYHLGANSYVQKPKEPEEYIDAVRQLATYWLSVNEAH